MLVSFKVKGFKGIRQGGVDNLGQVNIFTGKATDKDCQWFVYTDDSLTSRLTPMISIVLPTPPA
jgi:hypothetical protein